jgi:diketogulonate reductase-like aldo/keto reductase
MNDERLVQLSNNVVMPRLGLGLFKVPKEKTTFLVESALEIGYRLFDTAALYGNERQVGEAIKQSAVPRSEVFVTTKLHPARVLGVERAFQASLRLLGLEYVDLYLIHWPFLRTPVIWKSVERLYAQKVVRAVGVSNFRVQDLKKLAGYSGMTPMVNQVEFHPFLYRKELLEYCKKHEIVLEAHSPLTHGKKSGDKRVTAIAQAHGKSNAQVLIRWSIQHGTVVIAKTAHAERLRENAAVFDFTLSAKDMSALDELDEGYHVAGLSRILGDDKS